MVKEFSVISEIKAIREQKSRLSEREYELSRPVLSDFSLIPEIYEWFKDVLSDSDFPRNIDSPMQRRKFIFIILFLYSPGTLAGGKMKIGLRDKISEVTGCSGSLISHNSENVVFFYQQYKDYRSEIDHVFNEIISRLKQKGRI